MWVVMMVAMMVPTAVPMTLLYAAVARVRPRRWLCRDVGDLQRGGHRRQWGLDQATLLSPMMVSRSAWLGGALLIAAGIYQLTSLKNACLRNCRAPAHFLSRHWRNGRRAPSAWACSWAPTAWAAAGS
jgi:predicted metal-binding membrane protein